MKNVVPVFCLRSRFADSVIPAKAGIDGSPLLHGSELTMHPELVEGLDFPVSSTEQASQACPQLDWGCGMTIKKG